MSTELTVQDREQLIKSMSPALRSARTELLKHVRATYEATVMEAWECGAIIADLLKKEAFTEKQPVETLAKALGMPSNKLYDYRHVSQTWTKREMQKLLSRTTPAGDCLSWAHILVLVGIDDAATRKAAEDGAIKSGWSVQQLTFEVGSKKTIASKASNGGRPPSMPTSPSAGMEQLSKVCKTFIGKEDVWRDGVFKELLKSPEDDFTPEMLTKAQETLEVIDDLIASAMAHRDDVLKVITKIERHLDKTRAEQRASESSDKKVAAPKKGDDESDYMRPVTAGKMADDDDSGGEKITKPKPFKKSKAKDGEDDPPAKKKAAKKSPKKKSPKKKSPKDTDE